MSWTTMIRERSQSSNATEFEDAMRMAKEGMKMAKQGFETVCELAEEMREQYGERHGSMGYRSSMGYRDEMDGYGERRGRDSRGRYM